ncbi:tetratricopeptide repeat-containing sensor histidine kinase [Flavobacterium restrictum]|uniref:histidine kinase n=1 Tax=Flavobacterium restrictum TaxID=2594428 RepID=A0A553DSH2_9FLAO|nr:ATP-binding protein [Flavobacterium restrictum]TRX35642.1 ATP-binding protein [Flavobacterium restrictum]
MILKKFLFPIFVIVLLVVLSLHSCQKETSKTTTIKSNYSYSTVIELAEKQYYKQQFDSAFYNYNVIKSNSNPAKDKAKIIYALIKMAYIQQVQGDYSGSETTATEAITYFDKTTEPAYKTAIYNQLAGNYQNLFDYKAAIQQYQLALQLATNDLQKSIVKNNIAVIYINQKKYPKAFALLEPLILRKEILDNDEKFALVLDNLGFCYFKVNNPKSIPYLQNALRLREKIQDTNGEVSSYLNLAAVYSGVNSVQASKYARLAYQKATPIHSVDDRLKALELLIKNNSQTASKSFSVVYFALNDSIKIVRQKAKNQFAKIRYDATKEKNENLTLKAQKATNALELEQQKNSTLFMYFLSALAFLLLLFVYYFWKTKNKKDQIKTAYCTETRISKKLHDELANDVFHTMAFAETQDLSTAENKELLLQNLETIYSRTRNISKENSSIETGIHFLPNLTEMLSSFNSHQVNVILKDSDTIAWETVESNKKITVYRVLQELLVNMKKHSKCSLVIISFEKNEKNIDIEFKDNGVGADLGSMNMKNGLQNMENRILAIEGTITFETASNKGFKVYFNFPK